MKVSASTIARTGVLALALVNQILSATGHHVIPIEDAQIETLVSTGFTVVAALVSWWKNNSFTAAALKGDEAMKEAKKK